MTVTGGPLLLLELHRRGTTGPETTSDSIPPPGDWVLKVGFGPVTLLLTGCQGAFSTELEGRVVKVEVMVSSCRSLGSCPTLKGAGTAKSPTCREKQAAQFGKLHSRDIQLCTGAASRCWQPCQQHGSAPGHVYCCLGRFGTAVVLWETEMGHGRFCCAVAATTLVLRYSWWVCAYSRCSV